MPCGLKQQQEALWLDLNCKGEQPAFSALPQDPMTDHSNIANKGWGGVHTGKKADIEGEWFSHTPLEDYSPNITQLMERLMWPRRLQCCGLRNGLLCPFFCQHWCQEKKFKRYSTLLIFKSTIWRGCQVPEIINVILPLLYQNVFFFHCS